jgi:hypothetical protein
MHHLIHPPSVPPAPILFAPTIAPAISVTTTSSAPAPSNDFAAFLAGVLVGALALALLTDDQRKSS